LEQRPGFALLRMQGRNANRAFRHEPGGHRWQRVPPTEKRGRVHTSTITVAVMREPAETELALPERDLEWKTTTGSGPGGQHRNKTESAVLLTHLPSGVRVRCETERSQQQNRMLALALLRARLLDARQSQAMASANADRRAQIGTGMRGDKVRTIRADGVTDHRRQVRWPLKDYLRGDLGPLRD
jgi:peptide chain release factor 1